MAPRVGIYTEGVLEHVGNMIRIIVDEGDLQVGQRRGVAEAELTYRHINWMAMLNQVLVYIFLHVCNGVMSTSVDN
jgi:hypothetical protein